mmetsp:Transcript_13491/g.19743  ORF Transcript_13491/g.19743 Transcript_13491/m.19743 type:complete len:308 (-) Transcript_13491:590-1513(-)
MPGRHPPTPTTKIVALLCVLITIAPLATIHRLLTMSDYDDGSPSVVFLASSGGDGSREGSDDDFAPSSSSSSFGKILQSDHVTVDDIVRGLFKDSMGQVAPGPFGSFLFLGAGNAAPFIRMNHFTLLLPWCMSLIMGVVIPSILALISYFQARRRGTAYDQSDEEQFFSRMNRKEKRMCRLIICIRHFKKVLKESDFVAFNDDYGKEESIEKRGLVMLPTPGRRYGQKHAHRQCSRLCAVCLTQYESGDTIVWSSNSECQHVFHEKCIISWSMRKRNQLCPCCRQHFIDPKLDTSEVALYSELETDE